MPLWWVLLIIQLFTSLAHYMLAPLYHCIHLSAFVPLLMLEVNQTAPNFTYDRILPLPAPFYASIHALYFHSLPQPILDPTYQVFHPLVLADMKVSTSMYYKSTICILAGLLLTALPVSIFCPFSRSVSLVRYGNLKTVHLPSSRYCKSTIKRQHTLTLEVK